MKSSRDALAGVVAPRLLLGAVPLGAARLELRHAPRQVPIDPAGAVVGGVHARTGDRLVAIQQVLALTETIQEDGHGADIQGMGGEPHQVVQDARDLVEQGADVLGALRRLHPQQLLDGPHIAVLVAHHGHIVQTVHVADALVVGLGLGQLLGAPVEQADVRVGALDHLAVQFQHQAQDPMGGRVLRPEVQGVVADSQAWVAAPLATAGRS